MRDQEKLRRYLELCYEVCQRLKRSGDWPYPGARRQVLDQDVVESRD